MAYSFPKPPSTLGGFVAAKWEMQTLCGSCDGVNKKNVDMAAEMKTHGADFPLDQWMLNQHCPKCDRKLSMYDMPPQDQVPISSMDETWGAAQKLQHTKAKA